MISNQLLAITNNPLVIEGYKEKMNILTSNGKYLDILRLVRDKVHEGYKLVTHPLMGSIKPNETPYRSLIVEIGSSLDFQSLEIIESSIQSCEKFLRDNPTPEWSQKVLEDFQFVDSKLFESAIQSTIF